MPYRRIPITQRPERFSLNRNHPLHTDLVFAGLGQFVGSNLYCDSSSKAVHGVLVHQVTNPDTAKTGWFWDSTLRRNVLNGTSPYSWVQTYVDSYAAPLPLTLSCWFRQSVANAYGAAVLCVGCVAPYSNCAWIGLSGLYGSASSKVNATVYGARIQTAWSSDSYSQLGWNHACGVCANNNSRVAWVNGVPGSVNASLSGLGGPPKIYHIRVANLQNNIADDVTGLQAYTMPPHTADALIHKRALSGEEIKQLADPSNIMLSGLILPPRRVSFVTGWNDASLVNRRRRALCTG